MPTMKATSVMLPTQFYVELDRLVADGVFSNRSEALRCGARELLLKYSKTAKRTGATQ